MSKKLLQDPQAEQEANDIGSRFMDSADVVGDMSRSLGYDFSSVHIHTDQEAARRVEGTGADAFASGKDIFFGRGVFQPNDRASRGLLAHELTHTMQQSGGGEVQAQAPEGAMQGGLLDWFRGKFGKKKPEDLQISEPTLVSGPGDPVTKTIKKADGSLVQRKFLNSSSYALNEMLQGASREQLRSPLVRDLVLQDFNANMNTRLQNLQANNSTELDEEAFRRGAGELQTLNMVLQATLPEGFSGQVMEAQKSGGVDGALDFISQSVGENEDAMSLMAATAPAFEGISRFDSPESRSRIMMNNLVLRAVNNPIIDAYGNKDRMLANKLKAEGKSEAEVAAATRQLDKSDVVRAMRLQKEVNTGESASATRLRELLLHRFQYR